MSIPAKCKIEHCANYRRAKGYCKSHYGSYWRHGDPLYTERRKAAIQSMICTIDGCNRRGRYIDGICTMHHKRLLANGDYGLRSKPVTEGRELYTTWTQMKQRCYNQDKESYQHYGGRGIKVCDEWLNDYNAFSKYMGKRPTPKHTVDRIDNDGNYEPGNVRWADGTTQRLNSRTRQSSISGAKGVSYHKGDRRWRAYITVRGVTKYLKTYATKEEAIVAREQAELLVVSRGYKL